MQHDEVPGYVTISYGIALKPWENDPDRYSVPVTVSIMAYLADQADPDATEPAGCIELTVIKVAEVVNDRMRLNDVVEAAQLESLFSVLFENDVPRTDLDIDFVPGDVVFIRTVNLEPQYVRTRLFFQALETTIASVATFALITSTKGTLDLGKREWTQLGFELIPGTDFIYRDNYSIHAHRKAY